jgi:hypothetical protein
MKARTEHEIVTHPMLAIGNHDASRRRAPRRRNDEDEFEDSDNGPYHCRDCGAFASDKSSFLAHVVSAQHRASISRNRSQRTNNIELDEPIIDGDSDFDKDDSDEDDNDNNAANEMQIEDAAPFGTTTPSLSDSPSRGKRKSTKFTLLPKEDQLFHQLYLESRMTATQIDMVLKLVHKFNTSPKEFKIDKVYLVLFLRCVCVCVCVCITIFV